MEDEIILAVVLASISGLYWALFKQHGCLKRIETKVNSLTDMEEIKEQLTDLKDSMRQLNG